MLANCRSAQASEPLVQVVHMPPLGMWVVVMRYGLPIDRQRNAEVESRQPLQAGVGVEGVGAGLVGRAT